jgi:hypothetical protein
MFLNTKVASSPRDFPQCRENVAVKVLARSKPNPRSRGIRNPYICGIEPPRSRSLSNMELGREPLKEHVTIFLQQTFTGSNESLLNISSKREAGKLPVSKPFSLGIRGF